VNDRTVPRRHLSTNEGQFSQLPTAIISDDLL